MTRSARFRAYGAAALLVVAGIVCAVVISGGLGQSLAMVLIGLGLVAAVSLAFFEVGLSEDHARAREEEAARARGAAAAPGQGTPAGRRGRPRLGRMRGQSRRLER